MKGRAAILIGVVLALVPTVLAATTWDEPWQEDVVRQADCFVKVSVVSRDDSNRVEVDLLEQLAGVTAPRRIRLRGYSRLELTSYSVDEELEYPLDTGAIYYLLLKRDSSGAWWSLPTPSSGFAPLTPYGVYATYRHSYHQALVVPAVYERTMTAIFQHLHGLPHDTAFIERYMAAQLAMPPQDAPEKASDSGALARFSHQHAALECFYYFGSEKRYALLKPFLASKSFHVLISAIRAASIITNADAKEQLLTFVKGTQYDRFLRVMAVWGLRRQGAREYLPELVKIAPTASNEMVSFGGNIMDPRVGTPLPTVKGALTALIAEWKKG